METLSRQDALRGSVSHASRSSSVSSGMTAHSVSTHTHAPEVNPLPAYIAPATASEVAGRYQPCSIIDEDGDERPVTPQPRDPKFSQGALILLNTFLDELLYNCLAVSRSSTLAVLRRAVEQVLKGRLARYATASADEEINDLLPDGDDPEEADFREKEKDASFKWDLETVWRRARLKIMVYTHMGELEEEDEEFFLEEEREQTNSQEEWRSSHASRQVSWSAIVFMTSVLEYVAEQCIIVAGQAAFDRVHKRRIARDGRVTPSTVHGDGGGDDDDDDDERIQIIEQDVEKLALNPTLGRMWRHWRRGLKSSKIGRPQPHRAWRSSSNETGRQRSNSNISGASQGVEEQQQPLRVNREIARRALGTPSDQGIIEDSGEEEHDKKAARRSRSYIKTPMILHDLGIVNSSKAQAVSGLPDLRPDVGHQRPRSLPPPAPKRFSLPIEFSKSPFAEEAKSVLDSHKEPRVDRRRDVHVNEIDREDDDSDASQSQHTVSETSRTPDPNSRRPPSEYDPYRFDQSDQAQAQEPSVARINSLERTVEQPESFDGSSHGSVTKARQKPLVQREVSDSAILGSTAQQRKAKKPESLNVTTSPTGKPTGKGKPTSAKGSEQRQEISPKYTPFPYTKPRHTEALVSSPTETNDTQRSPSPRPSPQSQNQRKYTDESSDVYETPPRSPETHTPSSIKGSEEKKAGLTHGFDEVESSLANPVHQKHHRPTKSDQSFGSKSEKDFNDLVTGVETRKRTLTPKNLRDIEAPNSAITRQEPIKDKHPAFNNDHAITTTGSIPEEEASPSQARPTQISTDQSRFKRSQESNDRRKVPVVPKSPKEPPPARSGQGNSKSNWTARDARTETGTTRDFADFIRSTAPQTSEQQAPSAVPPKSGGKASGAPTGGKDAKKAKTSAVPPSLDSPLRSNPPDQNFAAMNTAASAGAGGDAGMLGGRSAGNKTVPSVRKKGAQPREAVAERATNDELISFLNQGPPQVGAKVTGNNQPAQSTQQSAPGSAGPTASSNSRTFDRLSSANRSSSQTSQSVAESTNSRSGLLTKRNTAGTNATTASSSNKTDSHYSSKATTPVSATKPTATSGATDFAGQGQGPPQRKQRRVKDPYAISDEDEDDEHDDELGDLPSREDTHGESLIDFLRNSEPPATSSNGPATTSPASTQQLPKGVTSSSAVGGPVATSRVSRGTSTPQLSTYPTTTSNTKDTGSGRPSRTTSLRRNNNNANNNSNNSGGTSTPTGGGVSSPSDALPDFLRESRNPSATRDDSGAGSRQKASDDNFRAENNRSASPRKAAGGGKGVGVGSVDGRARMRKFFDRFGGKESASPGQSVGAGGGNH